MMSGNTYCSKRIGSGMTFWLDKYQTGEIKRFSKLKNTIEVCLSCANLRL